MKKNSDMGWVRTRPGLTKSSCTTKNNMECIFLTFLSFFSTQNHPKKSVSGCPRCQKKNKQSPILLKTLSCSKQFDHRVCVVDNKEALFKPSLRYSKDQARLQNGGPDRFHSQNEISYFHISKMRFILIWLWHFMNFKKILKFLDSDLKMEIWHYYP